MQFDSIHDAQMYLNGSFLKFHRNDDPDNLMYGTVLEVTTRYPDFGDPHPGAQIRLAGNRNSSWYNLDEITFPPQNLELGNLQYGDQLFYCQRIHIMAVADTI